MMKWKHARVPVFMVMLLNLLFFFLQTGTYINLFILEKLFSKKTM